MALKILNLQKRIAKDVSKTVKSAIANAENNYQFGMTIFCERGFCRKIYCDEKVRPEQKESQSYKKLTVD